MAFAAIIVAVLSAAITIVAVYFARRAADAADTATNIELERRHAELRPHFKVTCQQLNPGSEQLRMTVQLIGPPDLEQLEELTVTIRDDNYFRLKRPPAPGSTDLPADHVWGPTRFVPGTGPGVGTRSGAQGADRAGRETRSVGMPVGESHVYAIEPNPPPAAAHWTTEGWRAEVGTTMRLRFDCQRNGWKPWATVGEIDVGGELTIVEM